MKKTAITLGDPNSISPEIIIKSLNFLDLPKENIILIANNNVLNYYSEKFNLSLEKDYEIIEIPYKKEDIKIGEETEEAGEFSFCALKTACDLAVENKINAIVTGPVSKNALNMAGHHYSGQTEILEQYLANSNQQAEMLFIGSDFSVMLLTRHIPLKDVPFVLSKEMIFNKVKVLNTAFNLQLGISNPKFAICALNPHAGEKGVIGDEEINIIIPAVKALQSTGINIEGPFPSDTLFTKCLDENCDYDCFIALYHDQGLIPVKLLERGSCVNTTIGLNILRTSPAHGTAFDIAGKMTANPDSMIRAIELAIK